MSIIECVENVLIFFFLQKKKNQTLSVSDIQTQTDTHAHTQAHTHTQARSILPCSETNSCVTQGKRVVTKAQINKQRETEGVGQEEGMRV